MLEDTRTRLTQQVAVSPVGQTMPERRSVQTVLRARSPVIVERSISRRLIISVICAGMSFRSGCKQGV